MTDPAGGVPDPDLRCPWCSAVTPAGAATCPSCGAVLREVSAEAAIPGVTSLDPLTAARKPIARPNRLVSWLAGDLDPLPGPDPTLPLRASSTGDPAALQGAGPSSYAPPSAEVRREMARLELEAIKAELESKAAEAAVDATPPVPPASTEPGGSGEGSAG